MYSGLLQRRLGLFLSYAQEEKTHAQQSYLMLFVSAFVSAVQSLNTMLEAVGATSRSELFALPDGWLTAGSKYYSENPLSDQQLSTFEDALCDLIGLPKSLRGANNSSPGSTPAYSSKGSNLSLLDAPKTQDPFTIPIRPLVLQPLSPIGSTSNSPKPALNVAGYRPLQYWIFPTPHKRHPIISILKKDIRRALTFMMESLSSVTSAEALRLMSQAMYIICETSQSSSFGHTPTSAVTPFQSHFALSSSVGSPTIGDGPLDSPSESSIPASFSSVPNGPNTLVKAEFLFAQCKPFARSFSPLLWHATAIAVMAGVVGTPTQSSVLISTMPGSDGASAGGPESFARRLWLSLLENSAWAGSSGETVSDAFDPVVISRATRQVALQWLPTLALRDLLSSSSHGSAEIDWSSSISAQLFPLRNLLFPVFFDDLGTIESKIRALLDFYASSPAGVSETRPPSAFLNVLSLISDFALSDAPSQLPKVFAVFRLLRFVMRKFYPLLFDESIGMIERAIDAAPWLLERLHELLRVVRDSNDPLDAAIYKPLVNRVIELLRTRSMRSGPLTAKEVSFYLPIIKTISGLFFVNPSSLLESLLRLLKRFMLANASSRVLHPNQVWPLGDSVLKILHIVMLSHKPRHLFGILRELLSALAVDYPDVGAFSSLASRCLVLLLILQLQIFAIALTFCISYWPTCPMRRLLTF